MKSTFYILFSVFLIAGTALTATAQDAKRFHIFVEGNETYGETTLPELVIASKMPTQGELKMGKKRLEDLRQLEWSVHKVYPYAKRFGDFMNDVDKQLAALPKNSAKRKLIKAREEELFTKYENDMRHFNEHQGRVFVRLVYRQTGHSMFDIVKEKRTVFTALFWQTATQVWDIDLHTEYHPKENSWDAQIENHVRVLESGGYNKVYKASNYVIN